MLRWLACCRAQILSRKVSPRAFKEQPGKKGQATGEVGIEGTAIEAPVEVCLQQSYPSIERDSSGDMHQIDNSGRARWSCSRLAPWLYASAASPQAVSAALMAS